MDCDHFPFWLKNPSSNVSDRGTFLSSELASLGSELSLKNWWSIGIWDCNQPDKNLLLSLSLSILYSILRAAQSKAIAIAIIVAQLRVFSRFGQVPTTYIMRAGSCGPILALLLDQSIYFTFWTNLFFPQARQKSILPLTYLSKSLLGFRNEENNVRMVNVYAICCFCKLQKRKRQNHDTDLAFYFLIKETLPL